jgi:diguanylate cyclase (GGDEF)-like protein/PAS domain S-box-containing protein
MDAVPYPQPKETLRILFVEDNEDDLALVLHELKHAGLVFEPVVARAKSEFMAQVAAEPFDVVVADYRLEGWTGMEALQVMRALQRNTPFILVTGVLGDELAVGCVKEGVSDYILKDRIARLPLAVLRAVNQVSSDRQHQQAVARVRETESMFHTLAESIDSAIFVYLGSKCLYANHEAEVITGYRRDELLSMNSLNLVDAESRENVIQMGFRSQQDGERSRHCEVRIRSKSGETKCLNMTSRAIEIGGRLGRLVTAYDITGLKAEDEEVRRLASTDPLTGLANYRRLIGAFDAEFARSQRTGRSFSLMLLDLDELKKINTLHGHAVGSRAICRVGHVLQTQCRNVDLAARYGGDEFVLIMPETGVAQAQNVADRIATKIRADLEKPDISVSFGLATCPDNGRAFKDVLRIADRGMYSMKGLRAQDNGSSIANPLDPVLS